MTPRHAEIPAHIPVLITPVLAALALQDGERMIDGTFGNGGYSEAVLRTTGASVLALDRDPAVKARADELAARFPDRFSFARTRFSEMETAARDHGWTSVDAIALDVGVSSMQLDQADRGFSFLKPGPLDMRMDDTGETAADVINGYDLKVLSRIFAIYGEERRAGAVARAIARAREAGPIDTTTKLADIISRALGGRRGKALHPATRSFQAIRIYINDELGELARALEAAERLLCPKGRLAIVSFHSLEDRIAKQFLAKRSGNNSSLSRYLPEAADQPGPSFSLLTKRPQSADEAECAANPRARSARLRTAERTDAPAHPAGAPHSLSRIVFQEKWL